MLLRLGLDVEPTLQKSATNWLPFQSNYLDWTEKAVGPAVPDNFHWTCGTTAYPSEGDRDEVEALICNPAISEELLEELYRHTGAFAGLPNDRWCQLVVQSSRNERLNTDKSNFIGPDLGHFHIHNAIFHLLETAPVDETWLKALYYLLDKLDPDEVAHPERIDHVLSRWKSVKVDENSKGQYASLSMAEEFRCLIAALYGRYSGRDNADSPDVAVRCGYYSKSSFILRLKQ
jgi:hypothetical protein